MKELIKRKVMRRLENLAKKTIATYKPIVIGVAGSVGKTSTKEAIFAVVSVRKNVRKSLKSYNNEFGVPLTVLGIESGFSSPVRWLLNLLQANSIAAGNDEDYPEVLVLEMGSDHVGDVQKLMRIAPPTVGVLTAISPVHLEFFENFENIKREESTIVRDLSESSFAVINGENKESFAATSSTPAHTLTYGFSDEFDVWAEECTIVSDPEIGMSFRLHTSGEAHEVLLPDIISKTHVLSALAAVAVGLHLQMSVTDIIQGLQGFEPPAGRMRFIPGIKRTHIIDDTYNSSPDAARAALDVLRDFPNVKKRFAVLGDMAELGSETESLHKEVGSYIPKRADVLITVGSKSKDIAHGAKKARMKESHVFSFDTAEEAGKFLQDRMHEGDIVLVKGSQVARLENVVREVMEEPQHAETLLVRQEGYWKKS